MDCIPCGVAKSRTWATFTHVFTESVMPSKYLILCHHLLLLPSIFPSIRIFSNELALGIRWPKYQRISFSISPFKEYSELISSRIDRFDHHTVPGHFKSLLHYHNSKWSVLCSAFFRVQLSHTFMTTGKTIALTIQIFVGKVMPLYFNTLCRFAIAYLPRRQWLLISWLQSPSPVILQPKNIIFATATTFPPPICHEVMGPEVLILIFWMLTFKPAFSLCSFNLIKRLFSSSLLSAIRVVSSAYLRLLIFLPAVLIPACDSSSLWSWIMYSA